MAIRQNQRRIRKVVKRPNERPALGSENAPEESPEDKKMNTSIKIDVPVALKPAYGIANPTDEHAMLRDGSLLCYRKSRTSSLGIQQS